MKKFSSVFLTFFLIATMIFSGCQSKENDTGEQVEKDQKTTEKVELTVSAAASLTDAMAEIEKAFLKEYSSIDLTFSFGGSGNLAKQIEQGAPVDVFLSADSKWTDTLAKKDLVLKDTITSFTGNKLVLISPKDSEPNITSFQELKSNDWKQLSIGEPESVPAGQYSKDTLESINLWNHVKDKIIFAKDVRQVLTYVESGNADLGIVYSSDALMSDKVQVLAEAEEKWHDPIVYPAAVVKASKHQDEAKQFVEFLSSEKAQSILKKYGFKK
ncbi:molybdate transport system substrate-binding protein [Oikeobacillus pervagus]|uniref:Molybdate transport system substrate-binding protein n=1 Tax=Oikeobacillus pervagus TaxID=1325931 RepID=A0AAJ1WJV3_9BACI|nr:molybdate ABC transporter substrate-binding protein [Oikeobacillus pervagus]MDQ0216060.1 molybdate transport system substrate-binding protein [Oikeobacillus pervagus]